MKSLLFCLMLANLLMFFANCVVHDAGMAALSFSAAAFAEFARISTVAAFDRFSKSTLTLKRDPAASHWRTVFSRSRRYAAV
jgi:hypothetical protein